MLLLIFKCSEVEPPIFLVYPIMPEKLSFSHHSNIACLRFEAVLHGNYVDFAVNVILIEMEFCILFNSFPSPRKFWCCYSPWCWPWTCIRLVGETEVS